MLDDLRQRVECLSRRRRAAIVLRYFADQDDEQIAETPGCSRNAVRSLVSRALAALRVEAGVVLTAAAVVVVLPASRSGPTARCCP